MHLYRMKTHLNFKKRIKTHRHANAVLKSKKIKQINLQ